MEDDEYIKLYRIVKKDWAKSHNGNGSKGKAGRWHDQGTPCIYTATERGIAAMEYFKYLARNPVGVPALIMITYEVPKSKLLYLGHFKNEQPGWLDDVGSTRTRGNTFFKEGRQLGLAVPSSMDPGVMNVILNPLHPDFKKDCRILNDTERYSVPGHQLELRSDSLELHSIKANRQKLYTELVGIEGHEKAIQLVQRLFAPVSESEHTEIAKFISGTQILKGEVKDTPDPFKIKPPNKLLH